MASADTVAERYLADILRTYRNQKTLGERALAQVSDADLHTLLDPDANSLAVIVKHLAGNLRSRFSDFLTTDGEKPDGNRDGEFEMPEQASRQALLASWEVGLGDRARVDRIARSWRPGAHRQHPQRAVPRD